ncbi:MAG: redoxin family protein [Planctomycetia bacterium]|nr:redoxin family protein [Planctomycetia bacterium]
MHTLSRVLILVIPLLVAVVVGCQSSTPTPKPKPAASIPVDVSVADFEALDAAVKAQTGKVVLVDFWATWCPPCRERFPHFVALHDKYADAGLACISVNVDKAGGTGQVDKQEVLDFLKKNDATFPNFLVADPEKHMERIGRRFGITGGLPFMAMFDKAGNKVWDTEEEDLRDKELAKLIEKQLAK